MNAAAAVTVRSAFSERCTDQVDAVFVIDSSSSIESDNFQILREFIAALVQRFRVGPDAAQVPFR